MSFIGLLLIILAIFILQPIIKGYLAMRKFRRQMQSAYRQATSANNTASSHSNRRGGWSEPTHRHRKVITREMGEYVAYEDVAVTTTNTQTDGSQTTSTIKEEQVIDAEWEEIH
ncbi:MAG: DUF4834 family protein [Bacteroides sp.]|nr:DUF4834 family protein [Bacteroides sp.]